APSVEQRMRAYHDLTHRAQTVKKSAPPKPTITLSRQFGCEAFPVAEELIRRAQEITGEPWLLVDKALLDEVAREHRIDPDIMQSLGEGPRWIDDIFASFSDRWKADADYYRLLGEQVLMIAATGNAVIVGLGAAIITKAMKNCHHFRLIADQDFKVRSIARRMNLSPQDAELMVLERQKERDRIIRRVLDADEHDPLLYHALFNNAKLRNPQIARMILGHVLHNES
uniref:cytidylate kinase-like family protein n=1 Tax=Geoalkalibacter sp. TaxID=3041440 RepID=UPI00272E5AB2